MWTVIAQMDPADMMRWNRDTNGPHWGLLVGILLLFALVALAVVLIVRLGSHRSGVAPAGPVAPPLASAEQLLAERLARGEIDPAEYRERLSALRGG
jgi:putative membrane protein